MSERPVGFVYAFCCAVGAIVCFVASGIAMLVWAVADRNAFAAIEEESS